MTRAISVQLNDASRHSSALHAEQVALVYQALPYALFTVLLSSAVLVAVQWHSIDHRILLGWLASVYAITAVRWLLYRRYHQLSAAADYRLWGRRFIAGTLIAGISWGAAAYLLFPPADPAHQVFLVFILAGMSAGSITTLAARHAAAEVFLIPALIPLIVRLLTTDTPLGIPMAAMTLLFMTLLIVNARRSQRTISEVLQLRRAQLLASEVIKDGAEQNRLILESAAEGIFGVDHDGLVTFVNPAAAAMLGYRPGELEGQKIHELIHHSYIDGTPYPQEACPMARTIRTGQAQRVADEVLWRRDGSCFPVDYSSMPIIREGTIQGAVVTFRDITEQRDAEARIEYQAYFDPLTGLPNRHLFMDRLQQAVTRSAHHGHMGALLFFDLDRFKTINDSLGHAIGDELLKQAAARLRQGLQQEDTAARLGGDEFVVLLPEVSDDAETTANHAQTVAEQVQQAITQPYRIDRHTLHSTASIGIALFPNGDESADDILKQADIAMYRAKESGRNAIQFYLPSMQLAASERLALENELRHALGSGELALHYQPQVDAAGHLLGAEALLRWQHPERGMVSPTEFIPVAEESDLILPIGQWVLEEACRQLKVWQREQPAIPPHIAVNVSVCQFRQRDFVAQVERTLREQGVAPDQLELELTEGMLLGDVEEAVTKMQALRAIGVRFAIDDFGTGYSSLAYLKRLPLDMLKIDQSFVRDITTDANDATIVETIIAMARHLELGVIAEGVETQEELRFLQSNGCDNYQGYYFSRPLDGEAFLAYLRAAQAPA